MNCEHDYKIIEDDININEIRYGDGDINIEISGYVIFYCKKCLDVQKKVL